MCCGELPAFAAEYDIMYSDLEVKLDRENLTRRDIVIFGGYRRTAADLAFYEGILAHINHGHFKV